MAERLPGISMSPMEGTYLAWLDCREAGIAGKPAEFFLKHARVGLNDGAWFGREGEGFVRLNFGCPRATLAEALERMAEALELEAGSWKLTLRTLPRIHTDLLSDPRKPVRIAANVRRTSQIATPPVS